jgi:hypothetical protein
MRMTATVLLAVCGLQKLAGLVFPVTCTYAYIYSNGQLTQDSCSIHRVPEVHYRGLRAEGLT